MVKVYAAKAALEQLAKLSPDPDDVSALEKRMFLLKLLSKNLYLDCPESDIARLNRLRLPVTPGGQEQPVALTDFERRLFRWRQNAPNPIQCGKDTIEAMRSGSAVSSSRLPQYLILNADATLCRQRMEQYKVVCIGVTPDGIQVDSDIWREYSERTQDLFGSFCSLLTGLTKKVRFFRVFDQHFFSNCSSIDFRKMYQSLPHSVCRVGIHFCADPNNRGWGAKSVGSAEVELVISKKAPALLPKIELVTDAMNRFDNHDRYIVSNQRVYVSGNTFSKGNCQSYIHSYPLGIYFESLPEKLKTAVLKLQSDETGY